MTRLTAAFKHLRAEGDDGSALVLALIITVTLGLLLGSALTFSGSSLAHTPKLRDQRNQLNYGQGTVDGAINFIRNSTTAGTDFAPCPTYTPPILASGLDSGADGSTRFRATCTGLDSGNEPGDNAPIFAIQTLGPVGGSVSGTPNGINQTLGSNAVLSIDGGIFSNGRIWNKGSGAVDMVVEGSVLATGVCSGTIHTTDPAGLQCNQAQPLGADPQYPPAVASSTALSTLISSSGADPLPTCPSTNSHVAWFTPGYYSEQPSTLLQEASNSAGSHCSGNEAVFWFEPGFYYFDFTNASAGNDWNVNQVVGGTPALGNTWTSNGNNLPTDGTACDSSTNDDSTPKSPGVQFIFGGNSTFDVGHAKFLELCGPDQAQSPGTTQSISLYGLNGNSNQGTSTPATVSDQERAASSAPSAAPVTGFLLPGNAQTIGDSLNSTAILGSNDSASLAYSQFQSIPAGASNVSVKIRLARTITAGDPKSETLSVKFPGSATATDVPVPNSCTNSTSPCDISMPSSVWPANAAHWRQFNGASLTYTAKTKNGGSATVNVDGISLLASYTQPTLEALSIGDKYFMDASDPQVTIYMHGTVYAPSVGVDVEGQNYGRVIFARGVILSTLLVDSNPSFTQTAAPFQTPGVKSNRLVKFIGSVSTDGGSTWTDLIQACVKYSDNNSSGPSGPSLPGYTLTVKGWTVLRSSSQQAPACA